MTIFRDRRPSIPDPYNPSRTVPGEWRDATTIEIPDSFIAPSSSAHSDTASRSQILTEVSLFAPVGSDVRPGDRIRDGDETYYLRVKPASFVSPFDDWEAGIEAPLEDREG